MNKPLTILHLIDNLRVGGAQEIILNIVRHGDKDRFRHQCVALHGPGTIGVYIQRLGIPVTYLSKHKFNLSASFFSFLRLCRRVQPDILNLHLEASTLLGLLMKNWHWKAKYVVSIHALREQLPAFFYPCLKLLIQRADGVVVEDHIAKRQISEIGCPYSRIRYIPIGVDCGDRFDPYRGCRQSIRAEFGIPKDAPVVLNIARLHHSKGHADLIKSFVTLRKRLPEAWLVIVGSGPEEGALRSLVAKLGFTDKIIFAGLRRDLEKFYVDADVFVMTALHENMGVVIYQAMSTGLPVIAYNAGSIDEIITDGESGYLIPTGDVEELANKIIDVLCDVELNKNTVGLVGKRRVENDHSALKMVEKYEKLYKEIVEN